MTSCELSTAPVFDLDPAQVGEVLLRVGALASTMGHKTIHETLTPYCNHPESLSAEAQFVLDVITRTVPEVVEKWYGGAFEASHLVSLSVSAALSETTEENHA